LFFFFAIFDFRETGGPSSVLLANTANPTIYEATAVNPAVLPKIGYNGIGLVYTKPFGITGLTYNRLTVSFTRPGLGFSLATLGQAGYHEYTFSLATAFLINEDFSYGLIVKGYYLNIGGYGDDFIPGLNLGVLWGKRDYWLGIVLEDLNNPKTRQGDLIPLTVRIGGSLSLVSNFSVKADWLRNTNWESFRGGLEFNILPIFSLRTGFSTSPYQLALGLGILFKNLSFDYACRYHPRLNETHIFSLMLKS
jgi:hypothetical protein